MNYKRPDYYEDDVVEYSRRGRHPKLSEKYKTHTLYYGGYWERHKHTLKSYFSEEEAKIALCYATKNTWPLINLVKVFRCPICGMYHMTSKENYERYLIKLFKLKNSNDR